MLTAIAILIDGMVFASWLFLVALGLTLICGVMKILNVAHGSFYAFGAYLSATVIGWWFREGFPDFGSLATVPENNPTATSRVVMPIENTNR